MWSVLRESSLSLANQQIDPSEPWSLITSPSQSLPVPLENLDLSDRRRIGIISFTNQAVNRQLNAHEAVHFPIHLILELWPYADFPLLIGQAASDHLRVADDPRVSARSVNVSRQ